MRVIAGTARSLPLKTLEGLQTRPTQDRVKETLFNMIHQGMQGCIFVDLFSGSGAIGIEALSRGASHAYFVESNHKACDIIKENLAFTKLMQQATVKNQEVLSAISTIIETQVDYIYLDPPYLEGVEVKVLEQLQNTSYVTSKTVIIIEASKETDFSYITKLGYRITKEKQYRTNKHIFMKLSYS
ncbi:MAG: 16S rRNA (guanine(966)-N(2))-methyltransferase RsmD [Eubacteriales bacterium]